MSARLEIASPAGDRTLRLVGITEIGRTLLGDPRVSKQHAVIEPKDGRWKLRDLGSHNGTRVNGQRVQEAFLDDADVIELGSCTLVFWHGSAEPEHVHIVEVDPIVTVSGSVEVPSAVKAFPPEHRLDEASLRRAYEKLRVEHTLGLETAYEHDVARLAGLACDYGLRVIAAEAAAVVVRDPADVWITLAHRAKEGGDDLLVSQTVLGWLVERRQALLLEDATQSETWGAAKSIALSGVRSLLAVPLLIGGEVRGALLLHNQRAGAFDISDLELAAAIGRHLGFAIERAEYEKRLTREAETRAVLSRFLSPALLSRVDALNGLGPSQRSPITVLFSDIRGFTTFSEAAGPEATVQMLGDYFDVAVESVFRFGGVLDKFIGDSVMAWWGGPFATPGDPERAIECALDMRLRLQRVNAKRVAAGLAAIPVGTGLATGHAVVGAIGTSRRLEYTAIGDTVNLASRLCGLAEADQVLATMASVTSSRFRVRELPPQAVKGKARPVPICAVEGLARR
jgi:adenylate cyclase